MGKYIQYLRKSQMDKDFDELSVEETLKRHETKLKEFTTRNKINVTVILKEVVSGESLSSRPQMMKALELINTGEYDGIVCMDIDRLSRGSGMDSSYIMSVLQLNNCKIITPDKTYDLQNESDEQFADMKFMFSRYELRTISKRLSAGRTSSASEGKYVGSVAPFGYEIIKLKGEKGNTLKIIPDEARVVQMIFDLYTKEGMGYNAVCNTLNSLHLKTKTGLDWTEASVLTILKNVLYAGKIRWKFKPQEKRMVEGKLVKKRIYNKDYDVHEGLHEAIITTEQWELAQKIRTSKHNSSTKIGKEIVNPFGGLLKCEKCGYAMIYKRYNASIQKRDRYMCKWANKKCDCRGSVAEDVENAIVKEMTNWLNGYLLILDTKETRPDDNLNVALGLLQQELEELQKQQNNICELLETGVYTVQMFTKRNNTLQSNIDQTQLDIENLKEQIFAQHKDRIVQSTIIPKTQHLLDNYDMLTPMEKNNLWKEVLHRITYYRNEKYGEFHITIYPKLQHKAPQPNSTKG